jgi:hypothetical protein
MDADFFFVRLGRFVVVVGVGLLFLFVLSEVAQTPRFDLFFIGLLMFIGGIMIIRRYRGDGGGGESQRFRFVRRLFSRDKK